MSNNLPTTPGPYWFREKGFDKWEPYYVTTLDGKGMVCHKSAFNVTSRCLVSEMPSGQWAKAHRPDEGIEAFMVFDRFGRVRHLGDVKDYGKLVNRPWQDLAESGYTCEPVTIYRKEKE